MEPPNIILLDVASAIRTFRESLVPHLEKIHQTEYEMIHNIVGYLDTLPYAMTKTEAYAHYVSDGDAPLYKEVDKAFLQLSADIAEKIQELGGYDEDGNLDYSFDSITNEDCILLSII